MQRLNFVSKTPLKSEWLYILRGSESEQMNGLKLTIRRTIKRGSCALPPL